MTYDNYLATIHGQLEKLTTPVPRHVFEKAKTLAGKIELLFAKNQQYKTVLDEAIRQFVKTGDWPSLEPEQKYLLNLRLLCAMDTLNLLLVGETNAKAMVVPQSEATPAIFLSWLLIDTWNNWRFDSFLKLTALVADRPAHPLYAP